MNGKFINPFDIYSVTISLNCIYDTNVSCNCNIPEGYNLPGHRYSITLGGQRIPIRMKGLL